jgi:hypothetical protein
MTYDVRGAVYSPTFKEPDLSRWPIPFPAVGKWYKIVNSDLSWNEGAVIFILKIIEEEGGPRALCIECLKDERIEKLRWVVPEQLVPSPTRLDFRFRLVPVAVDEPGDGG